MCTPESDSPGTFDSSAVNHLAKPDTGSPPVRFDSGMERVPGYPIHVLLRTLAGRGRWDTEWAPHAFLGLSVAGKSARSLALTK